MTTYPDQGALIIQAEPALIGLGHRAPTVDAYHIGAPIDYLIIDGYNEVKDGNRDREIRIVLADIKSSKAQLTTEQRRIRDACKAGRLEFRTIRLLEEFE